MVLDQDVQTMRSSATLRAGRLRAITMHLTYATGQTLTALSLLKQAQQHGNILSSGDPIRLRTFEGSSTRCVRIRHKSSRPVLRYRRDDNAPCTLSLPPTRSSSSYVRVTERRSSPFAVSRSLPSHPSMSSPSHTTMPCWATTPACGLGADSRSERVWL